MFGCEPQYATVQALSVFSKFTVKFTTMSTPKLYSNWPMDH